MSCQKDRREFSAFVRALSPDCEISLTTRGHIKVTFRGPKGEAIITQSNTPSDRRALLNARAQARRAALRVGCYVAS